MHSVKYEQALEKKEILTPATICMTHDDLEQAKKPVKKDKYCVILHVQDT